MSDDLRDAIAEALYAETWTEAKPDDPNPDWHRQFARWKAELAGRIAAAAARQWFTDWLREQRQFLPPQMCVDEGGMRTHEGPCDKPRPASTVIDALLAALGEVGGDQTTDPGGDDG